MQWTGYLYLLPAFLVFAAFVIYPLTQGAWLSLFDWDGFTTASWVGLGNYLSILGDPTLRTSFLRSLEMIVFASIIPIAIALLITAVISSKPMRGTTWYRAVLFVPQVLPIIVIGIIWRWMYAPDGPINSSLGAVGLGSLARGWLGDFTFALPAVGLTSTWVSVGFVMVLLLAGVQGIPRDLYDAAEVDGAGRVQEFRTITLPGLRNQLVVATIITVISAFRSFGLIFAMTSGGPGRETEVPAWLVYETTFRFYQVGLGAAIGMTLALAIIIAVASLAWVMARGQ